MNPASCFSASYREARERFLRLAAARSVTVDSRVLPRLTGLEGEPLATDVVRLGPAGARRLLVLTSGTHGVEGFCGSCSRMTRRISSRPFFMSSFGSKGVRPVSNS